MRLGGRHRPLQKLLTGFSRFTWTLLAAQGVQNPGLPGQLRHCFPSLVSFFRSRESCSFLLCYQTLLLLTILLPKSPEIPQNTWIYGCYSVSCYISKLSVEVALFENLSKNLEL